VYSIRRKESPPNGATAVSRLLCFGWFGRRFWTTNIVKEIREIRKLPATDGDVTALTILITVLGGLVGGLLGFLFRPSAPVIGQLPFDAVITRGSDLKGIEGLLKPTAEVSFNYVLGGAIIGGVVFAAWRHLTVRRRSERSPQ